jgi:hypothetical protein
MSFRVGALPVAYEVSCPSCGLMSPSLPRWITEIKINKTFFYLHWRSDGNSIAFIPHHMNRHRLFDPHNRCLLRVAFTRPRILSWRLAKTPRAENHPRGFKLDARSFERCRVGPGARAFWGLPHQRSNLNSVHVIFRIFACTPTLTSRRSFTRWEVSL